MPRYKMVVEYDGTPFVGFQFQPGLPTVQDVLEQASQRLNQDIRPRVFVAGRTDAGVHATGQVIHVDLHKDYPPLRLRTAMNAHLRHVVPSGSVAVVAVDRVEDTFHARFGAQERAYVYTLLNRPAPPALQRHRVWHVPYPLNLETMNQAAQVLVGHHDFTTFRAADCQSASPCKTLEALEVKHEGFPHEGLVTIHARSRSFLHHQVRLMVGALVHVGRGKWTVEDVAAALAARGSRHAAPMAPAHGLCLVHVGYGEQVGP